MNVKGAVGKFLPPDRLVGWAVQTAGQDAPVAITVEFQGRVIGEGRADLLRQAKGDRCRFDIQVVEKLSVPQAMSDALQVFAVVPGVRQPLAKSRQMCAPPVTDGGDVQQAEMTSLNVRVGTVSPDGVAAVGRDGFLFLMGGTNKAGAMYGLGEAGLARQWAQLVHRRQVDLQRMGVRFLQLMIPEKSSVLPALFHLPIAGPSPLYLDSKRALGIEGDLPSYILYLEDEMPKGPQRRDFFRKTDTHLAFTGAQATFKSQLDRLGLQVSWELADVMRTVHLGDLGEKFSPGFVEEVELPSKMLLNGQVSEPELVSETIPASGNLGTKRVYRNAAAPLREKVVVFGNSFFWGGGTSLGQSWWFARIFSEFHFVWSAEVDLDYVSLHEPDIVIAQTIERFMRRVPGR